MKHLPFKKLKTHFDHFRPHFYPAFPNNKNNISAGVLVALYDDPDWTCILTQRSSQLKDHSGEICFPGGKQQEEDIFLCNTALREAKEEVGLEAEIIGQLSSIPLYTSDFRLEPFVAIAKTPIAQLHCNEEVQHILPISLRHIFEQPYLEGTSFTYQGQNLLSPHFQSHHLMQDPPTKQVTYGGTAIVLYELLQQISLIIDRNIPTIKEVQWPKDLLK